MKVEYEMNIQNYDKNENFMGFGGKCEFDVWMLRSKPKSSQNFFGDDGLKA